MSQIKILQQILIWMVGDEDVHGIKIVDPDGFSVARRIDWHNAKYGRISVKLLARMHMIHMPQGKICAAMVRPGKANDSPYLRKMIKMMPTGSGDLRGGAIYGGVKSCNTVRDSGRRPVRSQVVYSPQRTQRQGRYDKVPR